MVSLMDRLLKLENLDLHLTPYKVLATGQDEGMLEFIPSSSLAQVLRLLPYRVLHFRRGVITSTNARECVTLSFSVFVILELVVACIVISTYFNWTRQLLYYLFSLYYSDSIRASQYYKLSSEVSSRRGWAFWDNSHLSRDIHKKLRWLLCYHIYTGNWRQVIIYLCTSKM